MLAERFTNETHTYDDIESILLELGHTRIMADRLIENRQDIIHPEHYSEFITVIKFVLTIYSIMLGFIFLVQLMISPMNIIDHFVQLLILGLTVIPMVFGWIVFGFFLAKFFFKGEGRKKWTPKQLPLVPKKEETQQRRDAMIAMTLFFLLAMLIILSRDYIGVWIFDDGQFKQTITFLQANMPIPTLLYIVIILGLLIVKETSKLTFKRNLKQAIFSAVINLISISIIIYLILHKALWNQKFMRSEEHTSELQSRGHLVCRLLLEKKNK